MKKLFLALALVGFSVVQLPVSNHVTWPHVSVAVRADEVVTLTAPISKPSTTILHIQRMTLDIDQKSIFIQWIGDDGLAQSAFYPTPAPADHPAQPTGATLLSTLNTGNNTVTSMLKKTYQRLQSDSYIAAGVISGTPN